MKKTRKQISESTRISKIPGTKHLKYFYEYSTVRYYIKGVDSYVYYSEGRHWERLGYATTKSQFVELVFRDIKLINSINYKYPSKIIYKPFKMDTKNLLNWAELSRILAGSRETVRKNKIPKIHREFINKLLKVIDSAMTDHVNYPTTKR